MAIQFAANFKKMAGRSKHTDDQHLICELQNGDEACFTSIFNQFYAPLVLYAYRITDDQVAAEDIIENAFINLWNKRHTLSEIRSLKSYLYAIARNGCISWIRKNNRDISRNNSIPTLEEVSERTSLESMIYSETMAMIYAAMEKLPPQCKRVFIMHYVEGKKIAEIATELKISIGTVKSHKVRGIDLLQKALLSLIFWVFIL
jgi:RNA polymerase sigma-70 factor (family 1)